MKFNDEQLRVAINLRAFYDAWQSARRALKALDYRLVWKRSKTGESLYRLIDRQGTGSSLGLRSPETEALLAQFTRDKADAQAREAGAYNSLDAACSQYRALKLPLIASPAAQILREADLQQLLGTSLIVVGTTAMAAYEMEAQTRFALGMDATEDFDMAWSGPITLGMARGSKAPVLGLLKAVDDTYTVNLERPFQARNRNAYEVEILLAPSVAGSYPKLERLQPLALPEQEWLLNGTPVDQMVCARDATPARIVAPDPRWFALHKLWLANQPKRDAKKAPKDARQGYAILNAVAAHMPNYPLDDDFAASLPDQLAPLFATWRAAQPPDAPPPRRF